jgi:hypothetical protein
MASGRTQLIMPPVRTQGQTHVTLGRIWSAACRSGECAMANNELPYAQQQEQALTVPCEGAVLRLDMMAAP